MQTTTTHHVPPTTCECETTTTHHATTTLPDGTTTTGGSTTTASSSTTSSTSVSGSTIVGATTTTVRTHHVTTTTRRSGAQGETTTFKPYVTVTSVLKPNGGNELPFTGSGSTPLVVLGIVLLATGLTLTLSQARRRERTSLKDDGERADSVKAVVRPLALLTAAASLLAVAATAYWSQRWNFVTIAMLVALTWSAILATIDAFSGRRRAPARPGRCEPARFRSRT